MKIFMASLATETNTFSPFVTTLDDFQAGTWFRNDASRHAPVLGSEPLIAWRQRGEADGHRVVESLCAYAEAGGLTPRHVYEGLRDTILADLQAAGPMEIVLLFLHGAMVAEGYDDCEGDTLARIREVTGSTVTIGVELDLHVHLTDLMCQAATFLVMFKEYPHIDIIDRADEVYDLCLAHAQGEVQPVMAVHDCRMLGVWPTTREPMRSFVARMRSLEGRDGVLSVSFGHGFAWGDVADTGAKILVITNGDAPGAAALASRLGLEVWAMREASATRYDTIDQALDAAESGMPGAAPLVIADVADNAGGGAPSDNTVILRRMVERHITGAAIGTFWDPLAAAFSFSAGIGAQFMLRLGGKCGMASGDPIDLLVTVRGLARNYTSPRPAGSISSYGDTAWVESGGIDILINTKRNQVYAPDLFTGLGVVLADKRVIVVKSTQHFHAGFAPMARDVRYVSCPGALVPDFVTIPYRKLRRPIWPCVADPFDSRNDLGKN